MSRKKGPIVSEGVISFRETRKRPGVEWKVRRDNGSPSAYQVSFIGTCENNPKKIRKERGKRLETKAQTHRKEIASRVRESAPMIFPQRTRCRIFLCQTLTLAD